MRGSEVIRRESILDRIHLIFFVKVQVYVQTSECPNYKISTP